MRRRSTFAAPQQEVDFDKPYISYGSLNALKYSNHKDGEKPSVAVLVKYETWLFISEMYDYLNSARRNI